MNQQNNHRENQLPKDWKWVKLGEVCEIISGKNKSKVINPQGKYPIYGSSGVFGYADEYLCNEGTTVVGRKGTINSPLFVKTKFWNVDTAFGLSPNLEYDNKLLYYFCLSFNFHKLDKSTTIPSLAKRDLLSIDIPLPPKSTQQAIVFKIEELFSELDKGIENLRLAQQQLKTYRQSVLKWAFEGKLTNENVKEGELPKGWKNVSITELAEKNKHALKAGPFGSSLKKEFYVEKGYKIYGQEQVINGDAFYGDYYVDEEKYQELNSCKIKPFDILISLVGTVGKVLLLPENCQAGIINPRLIKISLDRNVYSPKFFKYYFESSFVKSFYGAETRGTTMDVLNLGIIKTIPFPLCSIKEQNKIVQEIESRISVADKMEESITQSLQQAEALRQSTLKKAFEGMLL
jgi:type I restriction enzyme, S subunit